MTNLLFVFADQMRGMDMGCAGNAQVRTPTTDRLAREGLRLTHCFATTPVCCPNRAVLWTGTFPTTNRVPANDLPLSTDLPSLGTIVKAAGYRTGYVGKWHLDGIPRAKFTPPGPRRQGFDFWAAYNCAHDYFRTKYYRYTPELITAPGYEPQVQTDLALEYLDGQSAQQPFCLALSWGPPHDPYDQVPEEYRALYDPQTLTLRPNVQPDSANPLAATLECCRATADYYAAITALDDQLARLLDRLEQRNLSANTIVVFTSDHGDMLWSHGWMKKQSPYEESIRVPLLVRWPEHVTAGATADVLISTVDILPTLLGLLGLDPPVTIEGRNLSAQLLSKTADVPSSVLIASYLSHDEQVGRTPWLLFDNREDPYQLHNLVHSAAYQQTLKEHRQMLTGWLERTHDPFLPGEEFLESLGLGELWREREILLPEEMLKAWLQRS